MLKEKPIIAYAANCRQDTGNCLYPRRIEVSDTETAKEAFCFDCVFAQYTDNYRNASHFLWSNALPFDCDNDHSDKPEDWITAEDIAFFFAGVPHIIYYSRHHMKQKRDKSPRPRFHIIFLIDPMTSEPEYAAMKMSVLAAYPFFDDNAVDNARLFFGTEDPEVIVVDGSITLNGFLAVYKSDEDFLLDYREPIPEGKRNGTLTQIGARIIKRYGDTDEAYQKFLTETERCDPPLDDGEIEQIWQSRQSFFEKISGLPGYVPPDKYTGATTIEWDTPLPFDEYELPPFPVEALPEVIRGYVLAVSESTQTSVDMAAVEAIGVVALSGQGKYIIRGSTDWSEPLNAYMVIIYIHPKKRLALRDM